MPQPQQHTYELPAIYHLNAAAWCRMTMPLTASWCSSLRHRRCPFCFQLSDFTRCGWLLAMTSVLFHLFYFHPPYAWYAVCVHTTSLVFYVDVCIHIYMHLLGGRSRRISHVQQCSWRCCRKPFFVACDGALRALLAASASRATSHAEPVAECSRCWCPSQSLSVRWNIQRNKNS